VTPDDLPLVGVTILDLTRVLAGPYCTRLLGDLGARVIKIERPGEGDEMRRNYLQLEPRRDDQSSYFARVNAGKESVGVDMSRPEGQVIIRDLAKVVDVVVENFMPGVVTKLRCDYETLRAVKPDIVYCSISGFGQTGPWRSRPAFAHIINAVSGLMHLEQGDEPAPRASNLQAADVLAATHAATGILSALIRKSRTGKGAYFDVSMLEALIAADSVTYAAVLNGGEEYGNPRPGMIVAPIGDRYLAMQFTGSPQLWPRLLAVMGRPELGRDSRFDTSEKRRAPARRRVVARDVPDRRGRAQGPVGRAHPVRAGPAAGRGDRRASPGGARILSDHATPGSRCRACNSEPVPPRRRRAPSSSAGSVSRGGAHARCARRPPRLFA